MTTRFGSLLRFQTSHEYYNGSCPDFSLLLPESSQRLLRRGRMLLKQLNQQWHLLYEQDADGEPLAGMVGERIRFGLQLLNPYFGNFTADPLAEAGIVPVYRNSGDPDTLAAPVRMPLCAGIYSHRISQVGRPATLRLLQADGSVLHSVTVSLEHNREQYAFDLRELTPGDYQIEEVFPGNVQVLHPIYLEPELAQQPIAALVELELAEGFYDAAVDFTLNFQARQQPLRFYLVVRNYSEAEFAQLSVSDHGFAEEARPEILFQRIAANNFGNDEIPPELLARDGERVVLFRSQAPLLRRSSPRRRLQLRRNGDILVEHLPQPGADSIKAEQIVLVGKP